MQNPVCVWCMSAYMLYDQVAKCVRVYLGRMSPVEVGLRFFFV